MLKDTFNAMNEVRLSEFSSFWSIIEMLFLALTYHLIRMKHNNSTQLFKSESVQQQFDMIISCRQSIWVEMFGGYRFAFIQYWTSDLIIASINQYFNDICVCVRTFDYDVWFLSVWSIYITDYLIECLCDRIHLMI